MRILLNETVRDAAKRRVRWLFNESEGNIVCNPSGGKDSTDVRVYFNRYGPRLVISGGADPPRRMWLLAIGGWFYGPRSKWQGGWFHFQRWGK